MVDRALDSLSLGTVLSEALGLAEANEVTLLQPWHRSGAETYCTDFTIASAGQVRHLLAKACVKLCPAATMADWLVRRSALTGSGVSTPELLAVDGATLVEEFVPYTLKEAYEQADPVTQEQLRESFIGTYLKITGLGLSPLGLEDLRSRGQDIVVIDFGSDLGSQSVVNTVHSVAQAELAFRKLVT